LTYIYILFFYIDWEELSCNTNPNAIDLLRERAIEENNMSEKDYAKLKNKINWNVLSTNPNAIELLEENIHKIIWKYLSANSGAINLLKNTLMQLIGPIYQEIPMLLKF